SWLSLHDVATGKAVAAPKRLPASPRSVAARPSMPHVAVLCADRKLLVFDSRSGASVLELGHEGPPALWRNARAAYTPDGARLIALISGGSDAVFVRDAENGRPVYAPIQPVLQGGPCRTFAISADSRLFATAVNGKNAAQVWDL